MAVSLSYLQVYLQKLSQMMGYEEDMNLYSKSAAIKRRKRNPGGNPSLKRPYYGELDDLDLGKAAPFISSLLNCILYLVVSFLTE